MKRASNLWNNLRVELASQIAAALSGLALVTILARLLNPNDYGDLFFVISVIGVLSLFSKLGIPKSGARYISIYKEKDPGQLLHILKFTILYSFLATVFVSAIVFLLSGVLSENLDNPDLRVLLQISAIYILFFTPMTLVRLIFQGLEEIKLSATLNAINSIIRLVAVLALVSLGYGVVGALWGYTIGFAAVSIIGFSIIYTRVKSYDTTKTVKEGLPTRIFRYSIPLTVTKGADVIDRHIDIILVGYFLTPTAVSFYVVGKQIINFLKIPLSAVGFTLSPTFGAQKENDKTEKSSRIYETTLIHSLLLYIPAGAGLILTAEHIIRLIFGEDYLGAVPVLQVLAIFGVFLSITQITSNSLDYLGRARARAISKGITAGLNALLNILLIPHYGVVGAAIATVITFGIYTVVNFGIIYSELSLRPKYLAVQVIQILLVTTLMVASIYPLLDLITGWISLLTVIGVGVCVWAASAVTIGVLSVDTIKTRFSGT